MTDPELMAAIKAKYGAWIDAAVEGSPFPASLLAALTANETGLDDSAARFEAGIYQDLSLLLVGRKSSYGALGAQDMLVYLGGLVKPASVVLAMMNLATSWGPTQILGWHAPADGYPLTELVHPETHYRHTVKYLRDFAEEFHLMPVVEDSKGNGWEAFFRCWNSGSPSGRTFDPNYSGNGVRRLALYESLA